MKITKLFSNLYLGSSMDAQNLSLLKRLDITHVLTVAAELKPAYPSAFTYMHIQAHDRKEYQLNKYFDTMADFINDAIEKSKGTVFVHCKWGISRSVTATIAYLIKYRGMSLYEAKNFIKGQREFISPNSGFMEQLVEFSKQYYRGPFPNSYSNNVGTYKLPNTMVDHEQLLKQRIQNSIDSAIKQQIVRRYYHQNETPLRARGPKGEIRYEYRPYAGREGSSIFAQRVFNDEKPLKKVETPEMPFRPIYHVDPKVSGGERQVTLKLPPIMAKFSEPNVRLNNFESYTPPKGVGDKRGVGSVKNINIRQ